MQPPSCTIHFGDRVALQCEQGSPGFLSAHSPADPVLALSPLPESGLARHFERCVFTLERVTTWTAAAKATTEAENEPLTFGHFVRIRHVAAGAMVAAYRMRRSAENLTSFIVRLVGAQEPTDASSIWRVVSKYKIRQEGEKVNVGDHIVLIHEQLQLSLCVDERDDGTMDAKSSVSLAPQGSSFSFLISESSATARLREIHSGRCVLLFHKEQEAFLTLTDGEPNWGSPTSSPARDVPRKAKRKHRLCLTYPPIRDSTYTIAQLSFSSNSLWMVESPDTVSASVVQLAPACYRIKHLATGFYLAGADEGIALIADINVLARESNTADTTLWAFSGAGESTGGIASAATFFRLTNFTTGMWFHVSVTDGRASTASSPSKTPLTPSAVALTDVLTDGSGSDIDSDGPGQALALPPRGSRTRVLPTPGSLPEPAPKLFEAYTGFLGFATRTEPAAEARKMAHQTAVALADKPSYVDVFCAVTVPDDVCRFVCTVLGHGESFVRFLKAMRSTNRDEQLTRVQTLASAAASAFRDLIPCCTISEVTDEQLREGLPVPANQRVLVDQQLHLRALEVLVAPVTNPKTSIEDLAENSILTGGAMLSWQALGAAITVMGHAMHELCVLACRFLKLTAKNNRECCRQLLPFVPALLQFLEAVPQVSGIISEITNCLPTTPALTESICRAVLALDPDVLADHLNIVHLLHDLCFEDGAPSLAGRAVVAKCVAELGADVVPQFSIAGDQLHVSCPAAMHNDRQFLPLTSFSSSERPAEYLAAAIHLAAAIQGPDTEPRLITPDHVRAALQLKLPTSLRCAFIHFANSLAAVGSMHSCSNAETLIPWRQRDCEERARTEATPGFTAMTTHIVDLFCKTVNKYGQVDLSLGQVDPTGVDGDQRDTRVIPVINASLSFCITCALDDRLSDSQSAALAAATYALLAALPPPIDNAALQRWSERSVTYMEAIHHATVLLAVLHDNQARREADGFIREFQRSASVGTWTDADAESSIATLRARLDTATDEGSLAARLQRLIHLSTYDHALLPNGTLSLVFRTLCPIQAVCAQLSSRVVSFVSDTRGRVRCEAFARQVLRARELLAAPALAHLHSDRSAIEEFRTSVSIALGDCLSAAHSLPAELAPHARNIMLGYALHDLLIAELDTSDSLASATFEGEGDEGTVLMRALRLLVWFVADEPENAALVLPHFTVIGRLARCSPIFLSDDYSDLLHLLFARRTNLTLSVGVLVESLMSEVAQLSERHLDLISLLAQRTNDATRDGMRSAMAIALGTTAGNLLAVERSSLPGVLSAVAVVPTTSAEATQLSLALPFQSLLAYLADTDNNREMLVALCRAILNVHLLPSKTSPQLLESPTASTDDAVHLRDSILPAVNAAFFTPKHANQPTAALESIRDVALFVAEMLSLPSVRTYHRIFAGAASDLAINAGHFVTSMLQHIDDEQLRDVTYLSLMDAMRDLLATLSEVLRPRPPPTLAAPLALLQRFLDVHRPQTAAKDHVDDDSDDTTGEATSGPTTHRGITLLWQSAVRSLERAAELPTVEELEPLLSIYSAERDRCLEISIRHLRCSRLDDSVVVSLLASAKALLDKASEESEATLVEAQERLNALHATPLISVLLERPSFVIVKHAVQMGISLLEGGNKKCQDTLLRYFSSHDEKFFLTFRKVLKEGELSVAHRLKTGHGALIVPDSAASLVEDLLRLLQLLCEGHHFEFQNYVRHQHDNFNSYNMCITVMELLHTMLLVLDDTTVPVALQALNTLTELCQGPCAANQEAIVGCNIVTEVNRLLTDQFEGEVEEEELMALKSAAIICLSSLLEGSQDATIPNLMLTNLDLGALQALVAEAWDGRNDEDMLSLGFQLYMLAGTLVAQGDRAKSDKLRLMLEAGEGHKYFSGNLCRIEIWRDDDATFTRLETVFFRKPDICKLRDETKENVLNKVNRSSIISKHSDFVRLADDLIFEMEHQFTIESFAATKPAWMNAFGLLKARTRPVEDLLLLLGFALNAILLVSGNEPPLLVVALCKILGVSSMLASLYLLGARFVLMTPLVAHRAAKKHGRSDAEDPFLTLPSIKDKVRHVATKENLMKVARDSSSEMFAVCALLSFLGVTVSQFFHSFLLVLVIHKFPLLGNIVKAITMNGRQLLLTAFLGVVVIYFFSVVGFLFFPHMFQQEDGDGVNENCDTLLQCFFYSFSKGLRGGGGISEAMVDNKWGHHAYFYREAYDTLYFVLVAVIVMNIVFALIVDTFAELRDARKTIEEDMMTTCFICGIDAATFDRSGETFHAHTKGAHNMWQYLYFMHHLRRKEKSEYTGQESYVHAKLVKNDLSFFPVNRSKSLENAKALLAEEDEYKGPSLADIRKIVEDAVQAQVAEALKKQQASLQTSTGASPNMDDSDASRSGGWGVVRSRSMALLRRPTVVSQQSQNPAAAGGAASPAAKPKLLEALQSLRSRSGSSAENDGEMLAIHRQEMGKLKQDAKELLELLRA
jgi:hypothetical protein